MANLTLSCRAFPLSEVRIASLLESNGTLFLASQQRFLVLGANSGSDAESATILARKSALALSSCVVGLTLPGSFVDASEAVKALLLAQSALALASHDRRD